MKTIKAVIFDLDGVIIDSEPLQKEAFDLTMRPFHISFSNREFSTLIGIRSLDNFRNIVKQSGLSADAGELTRTKSMNYRKILKKKVRPMPGAIPLIHYLKKKYILAVASGSDRADVELPLKLLGIRKYFKVLVAGDEVKKGKPNPEIFLKTAKQLKVKPEECLVIEDSENGVKAAKKAGMACAAVPTPLTRSHDIKQADFVFKKLAEIRKIL